jgi:hypothetical protein
LETLASLQNQFINALIIFTTIHAQDFRDIDGDKMIGRRTIPTDWPPLLARASIILGIMAWSLGIGSSSTSWLTNLSFLVLGFSTSARFLMYQNPEADRKTYTVYNVSRNATNPVWLY